MSTPTPDPTLSKLETAGKKVIAIRIEWVAAIALAANLVGVILRL